MDSSGERHQGWVRSFRGTWGFLNSETFAGDVFVGLKSNPHLGDLAQDDQVDFEVKIDEKGKAEAVNVVLLSEKPSNGAGAVPTSKHQRQQQSSGERYKGWVRSFTGQWGFVNSEAFEGDLFVGMRSNPHLGPLNTGDQVEFEIKANNSGKQEAVNVVLEGQELPPPSGFGASALARSSGPAERAQVGHLVGQAVTGRIKSFKDQWGFVQSDSFVGDLFIHMRSNPELGPVGPGDPVQFEITEDPTSKGGECNATNAILLKDDVHNLMGLTMRGWVKSFKDSWGLINSSRFDGDVFVGMRANPQLVGGLQQGKCVEFQIAPDEKGANGVQAVKVRQLAEAIQLPLPSPHAAPITVPRIDPSNYGGPKPGPEAFVGHRARGVVRSFRDGWGFVVSEDFDGDLFLHSGSNPGLGTMTAGEAVTFDISLGSSGKCHATKVQAVPTELKDLVGRSCSGRVRSFHDTWGFVTSQKYPGDLFVGMKSNPHLTVPLKQGDSIVFMVQRSNTNKSQTGYEAVSVKVDGAPGPAYAALPVPTSSRGAPHPAPSTKSAGTFTEVVQRFSHLREARSRSPRPAPLTLARVRQGAPAPGGRGAGGRSPGSLVGSVVNGWVRSFRGSWGFAQSDSFEGDLFVGNKSNPHLPRELTTGDRIRFRVTQGSGGKLEAIDVSFM